ncbi:MAG: hypothetical protein ACK4PR_10350 [Gammaproteobacteria bacterium]
MIKKAVANMSTKQKTKAKQWVWFFGLYIGGVLLLTAFSLIVHVLLPQAS